MNCLKEFDPTVMLISLRIKRGQEKENRWDVM